MHAVRNAEHWLLADGSATIHTVQELPDFRRAGNDFLDFAGCEVGLVLEVREHSGGRVSWSWWREGRADCEDCADELGVVESDAEDDCSSPVVAAEDD